MKSKNLLFAALMAVVMLSACSNGQSQDNADKTTKKVNIPESIVLANDFDSISYAWGINLGTFLTSQGYSSINYEVLNKAIEDVLNKKNILLTDEAAKLMIQSYGQKLAEKVQKESQIKNAESIGKNKIDSEKFLNENKNKEGVVTLPSGLQYKVITNGTGPRPLSSDKVSVHYHGTLIDGTVFDSSVERGTPAEFGVTQVIRGWVEALQLMNVGSKWTLYIPADLAYGDNPRAGGVIQPAMALIFEVELLAIK